MIQNVKKRGPVIVASYTDSVETVRLVREVVVHGLAEEPVMLFRRVSAKSGARRE